MSPKRVSFTDIEGDVVKIIQKTLSLAEADQEAIDLFNMAKTWRKHLLAQKNLDRDNAFKRIYRRFAHKIKGSRVEKENALRKALKNFTELWEIQPIAQQSDPELTAEVSVEQIQIKLFGNKGVATDHTRFKGRMFSPDDEDYPQWPFE